jgi:hypothetical protein
MAEKSSELDNITAIDTDTAEEIMSGDTALQTRTGDELIESSTSGGAGTDDGATAETEQLREQIVETRREMGETIDAIQEKLSFSNISEQVQAQVSEQVSGAIESAKDAFYGKAGEIVNTVGRSFRQIGNTDLAKKAQQNPTALAIIGAGVGALLVSFLVSGKKSKRRPARTKRYDYDFDDDVRISDSPRRELKSSAENKSSESTLQSARKKIGDTASSAIESVSGAASTAYAGITNVAGSAAETVGNAAGKTYETVGSIAGKTYQGLGSAAGFTYEKAGVIGGQMKVNYNHYIKENPLAVGAVALALGAAVGFAIPLTAKENEYLGEYRDEVFDKAQATAQDALGTVKQLATEAQRVITEEVKSQTA